MSLDNALQVFHQKHGFGPTVGKRPRTVPVYTGCMLVPLPNIEARHRYLKYHDLHHLATGFSVGRIGEGQISAWELGTGSMSESPILGFMNLIALSTGWVLARDKMWSAFCLGRRSRNLYSRDMRKAIDSQQWTSVDQLQAKLVDCLPNRRSGAWDKTIFRLFVSVSLAIHACIAIPAMIVRTCSDLIHGKSLAQVFSPERRPDLF